MFEICSQATKTFQMPGEIVDALLGRQFCFKIYVSKKNLENPWDGYSVLQLCHPNDISNDQVEQVPPIQVFKLCSLYDISFLIFWPVALCSYILYAAIICSHLFMSYFFYKGVFFN